MSTEVRQAKADPNVRAIGQHCALLMNAGPPQRLGVKLASDEGAAATLRPPMQASSHLYTFGYEGIGIEAFVARMLTMGIETVVDVRERPLSRKKGFSKVAFSAALAQAGVAYRHDPQLGCPKAIRDRYKAGADWAEYTREFLA